MSILFSTQQGAQRSCYVKAESFKWRVWPIHLAILRLVAGMYGGTYGADVKL